MGLFDFFNNFVSDPSEDEMDEPITVDINSLNWSPDSGETLLVAHDKCQILKDNGTSVESFQYFTCCITDKRLVLVPKGSKPNKKVLSIVGSMLGINPIVKSILLKELCDSIIEHPVSISKEKINKAILSEDIPSGLIVEIKTNEFVLYLGFSDVGHAMDICVSIKQPELFKD